VFIGQTTTIPTLFEMWKCEITGRVAVSMPQKKNITPGRGAGTEAGVAVTGTIGK